VTEGEASDAMLVPAEFVAVTVTVYGCPKVSPVIVHGLDVHIPVTPPGEVSSPGSAVAV